MKTKSELSGNYMAQMKSKHGAKKSPQPGNQVVCITGTGREGSIGEHIAYSFGVEHEIKEMHIYPYDVRDTPRIPLETNVLIMCHGVTQLDWIECIDDDKIEEIMSVNLTSVARMMRQFVRQSIDSPWRKQVVVIGSMAHSHVLNGSAAYCASKAGLNMLCKCLAWELTPKGYDIYCINPSNTEGTPMTEDTIAGLQRYRNLTRKEAEAYWGDSNPRQEWLQPRDITRLVQALINGLCPHLVGNPIDLAGGQR